MKKIGLRLVSTLLAMGLIVSVTGCGKSATPPPSTANSNEVVSSSTSTTEVASNQPGVFSEAGTYTESVDGDAVVEADGVILSGLTVSGNLILSEKIGEGTVTLKGITVLGDTIIQGGGSHSVESFDSKLNKAMLDKEGGSPVRFLSQNTEIQELSVSSDAILEGSFRQVNCQDVAAVIVKGEVEALSLFGETNVTLESGHVSSIVLTEGADQAQLTIGAGTQVDELSLQSAAVVVVNGTVEQTTIGEGGAGASLTGTGSLGQMTGDTASIISEVGNGGANPPAPGPGASNPTPSAPSGTTPTTTPPPATTPSQTPTPSKTEDATDDGDYDRNDDRDNDRDEDRDTQAPARPTPTPPPTPTPISIVKVESIQNGLVRVTLSAATSTPLDLSYFSIICTGGGKDMTIQQVKTTDNRVYDLVTAYYNDNTYSLEITLPEGRIYHDFVSKFDCPDIRSTVMRRTTATEATFLFYSDSDGTLYYLLQETQSARLRTAAQEPTAETILQSGTSAPMQRQGNTVAITGLTDGAAYTVYYVAKGSDGTITPVKSIALSDEVEQSQQGAITVSSASGFDVPGADPTEELCGFTLTLSEPTSQPLELSAFQISCPASGIMSIGRVATQDNQTYTIYMQPGYLFVSNNTMTAKITFPNGDYTTYDFYVDIAAPTTGLVTITWTDANTAEADFSASEAGWIYYTILDSVSQTIGTKDPSFLFAEGPGVTKAPLSISNRITLTGAVEGKYFCYATEDQLGNRITYMGYDEIPAYVPPTPPVGGEDELAITDVVYSLESGNPTFRITFNKQFNVTTLNTSATTVTGVQGKPSYSRDAITGNTSDTITLRMTNGVSVLPGEQTITLSMWDDTTISAKVVVA